MGMAITTGTRVTVRWGVDVICGEVLQVAGDAARRIALVCLKPGGFDAECEDTVWMYTSDLEPAELSQAC